MKTHNRKGFTRLTAIILAAVCLLSVIFPLTVMALSPGTKAGSWWGDFYVSADGDYYYHPDVWYFMTYNADGSTSYNHFNGGTGYCHYMITDSSGETHSVYCMESGADFGSSDGGYTSQSSTDSTYYKRLPATAQRGIELTTLYGWKPGASLPVSGINADDYKFATQILIWEYQQQLRSDPNSRHNNGSVPADQFYGTLKGRPAEKAYNWILNQIKSHSTLPSFTSSTSEKAQTIELKWDDNKKVYAATVSDSNKVNVDFETLSGSGVSISRSGNSYTFTAKNMIENPVTFKFRKNIKNADDMLIWGRPGYQTLLTGAKDSIVFYVKIKTETFGTAKIVKTSEDGVVEGISFKITGDNYDKTVKTDKDGTISTQLLPGSYTVTELPSDKYVSQSPQNVTVTSGKTSTVTFSNVLKKFRVKATKVDSETKTAQGDATLAGALYGLFDGNKQIATFTTDANGSFETPYYVCGDNWTIKELLPSTGYLLSDAVYSVGAEAKDYELELNTAEMTLKETVVKGNIRLIKHVDEPDPDVSEKENGDGKSEGMAERPEANAVFEIYLKDAGSYDNAKETERDRVTTDKDGYAATKMLPYGHYTVHQATGENGKALMPDFTVFICKNNETYSYIIDNPDVTARIKVEKRDADTGKIIPIPGTGFQIKDLSTGKLVTQEIYYPNPETLDTFYVSDEGWLMLPEPLAMGDYELYEIAAPYGYVLSDKAIQFNVDGSETVVTVKQYNKAQMGQLTISKSGEVFATVQENEGLYQPVYEVQNLPGAVYDLIADEDIYTGDGTLRVAKDSVVETLKTGKDGTAKSNQLFLGRYRLEEKTAPNGCVLSTEPEYVELTYAGENVKINKVSVGLYDERQKASVELKKAIETDKTFGIEDKDVYKDITFGIYASKELKAVDGTTIPKDGLLEITAVTAGGEGEFGATFLTDLPLGSYYVKEHTTNEAYILSDKAYPVVFKPDDQTIPVVTLYVNDGENIENNILRGSIDGIKYGEDKDGGESKALDGALIGLFKGDAEDFTEENAIMTYTTGADGKFTFEKIPYGHFVVAEIQAPDGYTISMERHHVYISADGQTIPIRLDDTLIRGSVQVMKTEAVDEPSEAATPDEADSQNEENKDNSAFMRFLKGAIFDLYEDSNADGEFDSEDKLLYQLTEIHDGYHTAENLLAGGYFVKEQKAPEGYKLDENAYYFAITEDGQIAVIENGEAGRGFTNEAQRGNLKIIKDSSDGRKDGFSIEVKSKDGTYCETFTTPKDGIIEVNGLRVGVYTVTEISNRASQDYIIPDAATVEIKADETDTVQLFNEKPSTPTETPGKSVPQTSDNNLIFIYAGILVISVLGGLLFFFLRSRKAKRGPVGKNYKKVNIVVILLCMALAFTSAMMIYKDLAQYKESKAAYDKLYHSVATADSAELPTVSDTNAETPSEHIDPQAEHTRISPETISVDFDALRAEAPDVIGWLYQKDSVINYPVVQCEDNDYYLSHLFDGTPSKVGSLFADFENKPDFSDKNTIFYGHNMRDGSMLATLNCYADQSYFEENPKMYLDTPHGGYSVEIFSTFSAKPSESGTDVSPWRLDFKDDGAYSTWIANMAARSVIETGVTVTGSDKVLTLTTCNADGSQRFIVMGKLIQK